MIKTRIALPLPERLFKWTIIGTGIVCFILLAWDHLGLGALIAPPAPVPAQQTVAAGPYQVQMTLTPGQQTAGGANVVTFVVRDGAGHPVPDLQVRLHITMTTMAMSIPDLTATGDATGTYRAHPHYGMAGDWKVVAQIATPQLSALSATFAVSVHWN